ncbi:MAG: flavodoxin family protein [Coriobacteriales bacterium]|jgi:multimeric flavodoxin WrbA|nr:flavodoxin family protein [Coriobacteriales bacterium]
MSEINDMLSPDGITVTGQAVAETSNDDTAIDTKPDILFISGSPRRRASVALVGLLEQGARKAGAKTQHFFLCERHINPCIGCGSCEKTGICAFADRKVDGQLIDDYLELKALLDRVDAVGIVAPLYFAGPTAQFKALLDRLQPYYAQRYLLGHKKMPKRPAHLYVVGSGGDPHGYAPLVGTTRSAFNVAGFMIEKVHDFVGFLSPQDTSALYDGLDRDNTPATTELVRLRRAVARQEEFEARAISAGGAFARYVVKQQEANQLAAQLEEIKAEMEELKSVGDRVSPRLAESSPIIYDSRDEIELEYLNLIRRGRDRGREVSFSRDDAVGDDIDSAEVVSDDAVGDDILE